jgi:hypothetical protein
MKRSTKKQLITIFILLIFMGSTITYAIISAVPSGNTVSGWRAQMAIVIFGDQYPIPVDIGYTNTTKAKVFTTSTDGTLYKSVDGDVTLKDFFDAWNETFNSTCILSYCNTKSNTTNITSTVAMFVNGKINLEYENYVIQSNDQIIIDYR